jgi:hypothetical protein
MHGHNVYFWLKEGLSKEDLADFEKGLESLIKMPLAQGGYFGKPAATFRPVVDRSYTYGLHITFKDTHDEDLYQEHQIHTDFVKNHSAKWTKAVVYDIDTVMKV